MSLPFPERLASAVRSGLFTPEEGDTVVASIGFMVSAIDHAAPEIREATLDKMQTLQLINLPDQEPTDYFCEGKRIMKEIHG